MDLISFSRKRGSFFLAFNCNDIFFGINIFLLDQYFRFFEGNVCLVILVGFCENEMG